MWREWLGDRSQWHSRVPAGSAKAYLAATIFVAIAGLARWGLGFLGDGILPFPTFYPAVFFATVVGGVGAGVFAAALAATLGWGFMAPHFAFFPLSPEQEISLFLYLVSALLLVWGGEHYRTITKRLVDEEGLRQLAVEELSHRLKNKITTLQSIVSFQLREHPHLRNEVIKRLMALSKADGLIMGTAGKGADLRGILSTELGPYELSRMSSLPRPTDRGPGSPADATGPDPRPLPRASSLSCAVRSRAVHPKISMPTPRPALGGTKDEAAPSHPVAKTPKVQASPQSMLPPSMILQIMVVHGFRSQKKAQL